ncbi:MAG: SMC-Scp complex subunit ScpB [Clostridiaceae bacterium]
MEKYSIEQFEISSEGAKEKYISVIESLLFVSGEPLKLKQIASILDIETTTTKNILDELNVLYEEKNRGIKLININDEYQLVTKKENSSYIQKLLKVNSRQALSQASLETLSIIAYKQPITRVDIDEIRGVKSDRAVQTLTEKKLIKESGRLEVPGRPILYSTTEEFLRYFELETLEQMPSIKEFEQLTISEEFNEEARD